MKTSLIIKSPHEGTIETKIVKGYTVSHSHEYQVFPVKNANPYMGLIGVENGDVFAIHLKSTLKERFAWAIYLDGVNVVQDYGIKSLNDLQEEDRSNYKAHAKFIGESEGTYYNNCYSQSNGENREFTFTQKRNSGINEILLQDSSQENLIEIYFWKEAPDDFGVDYLPYADEFPGAFEENSKIGAGKATYQKFQEGTGLIDPVFMGKLKVIHQPADKVKHMGKTVIPVDDPMNKVPLS